MIKSYLRDMINDHKSQSEWKIQLTMQINFISSKDSEETRTMHTKKSNIEIMMGNETDEIIEKLFDSLLQKFKKGFSFTKLSKRINEKKRVYSCDSVNLWYHHLQKISLKRGGSYVDSSEWLKN